MELFNSNFIFVVIISKVFVNRKKKLRMPTCKSLFLLTIIFFFLTPPHHDGFEILYLTKTKTKKT
jgi:hypothetical protein